MPGDSVEEWVRQQDDLVETFRAGGRRGSEDPANHPVPMAFTNWIEEQQAILHSCGLGDLSHHMTAVHLEGPDVMRCLRHLCANRLDDFPVGRAKQVLLCSPDGFLIGDGPLLRLAEDEFYTAGLHGTKWLQFNVERGDYDLAIDIEPPTPLLPAGEDPDRFVYQLQGPSATDVLGKLTDVDLEDIGFFAFEEVQLAGHDVIVFGHGMSPEAGFELLGPYEHAEAVRDVITDAGVGHGLRRIGRRAQFSQSTKVGWLPPYPKPIYTSDALRDYRAWLDHDAERDYGKAHWATEGTLETNFSIEGSFDASDPAAYYLHPLDIGYGRLIDFGRDFVGREALARAAERERRTLVSLVWDRQDVERIATSLFGDGPRYKSFGGLPTIRRANMPYDDVRVGGQSVGISYTRAYQWDLRGVVSLASIDREYRRPGTELTLVWGEPGGTSPNPAIEDHEPVEVGTTVRPAPYKAKAKAEP